METRFPEGYRELFSAAFGEAAWRQYAQAMAQTYKRGLRVNPLRPRPAGLPLEDHIPWADQGYYLQFASTIGNDPLHAVGSLYLQEPSAMAPVTVLAPQPGERILDLCAAPGGKTTQIGGLMRHEGFLLANDAHAERCEALAENVERMGLTQTAIANAIPAKLTLAYERFFDGILVDAPCSGEGLFRREPDAMKHWSVPQVLANAKRQLEILEAAYLMLCDGSRLVYSTCTLNPIENEGVCAEFAARHPDLALLPVELPAASPALSTGDLQAAGAKHPGIGDFLSSLTDPWQTVPTQDAVRLLPQNGAGEGHFAALFQKRGQPAARVPRNTPAREQKKRRQTARDNLLLFPQFATFAKSALTADFRDWLGNSRTLDARGNTLYALTPEAGRIPTLLRPGLPVLRMEHGHAVPHHALAMALTPAGTTREFRLAYGDQRIIDYLKGLPIPCDGENGWRWVSLDGLPLGWGKAVNGTLKNHYPKGLRRAYAFSMST